ncbi:MAG: lipopolysaccharide biosynthesis protein [Lachnospiraceae bacterium]|nr:lipopolysaccharide biosynthesis protein [Lachnospiraceae bacterium]
MEAENNLRKKVFSGLFWKFGERITAQFVSLLISIVLARLLIPEDYGAVAIVMVFITIANVFVGNGFGNALIRKKDADNLDFSSVFYVGILISVIIYGVLFFMAPWVADFYDMPVLAPVLRVLGIRVIIAAVNTVQQAYVSRNMLFKRFFWSTLLGTVISGIVGIAMAYRGFGVWALAVQYLTNTTIDTLVLWCTVRWRPELGCSWGRVKELLAFGWKLLVSGLLDTGYKQVRSLIIGKKYTNSDLAFYNQGEKYPNLIVVNINSSISSVIFPAMSQYQDNPLRMKQMVRRAIQISSYIMWPMMIGLGAVAEPLIRMLLTEKWLPCVPYVRIFCFSYGLWPIHTANLQALNALGRSDLFLKLEIIKKSIGLAVLLVSMQISPLAMAYSLIIADIASVFINAAPNIRLLQYGYSEQLKDLLPPLLMAGVMFLVIYPISFLPVGDAAVVVLQIAVGAAVYLLESVLFRHEGFLYLVGLLNNGKVRNNGK